MFWRKDWTVVEEAPKKAVRRYRPVYVERPARPPGGVEASYIERVLINLHAYRLEGNNFAVPYGFTHPDVAEELAKERENLPKIPDIFVRKGKKVTPILWGDDEECPFL